MGEVLFFLAGIGAVAGAIGVVAVRNPFYSVLALVSHLLCLAALFLLLRAEFVAAAQVVVYAGAVMVLYVFVVAYVGGQDEPLGPRPANGLRGVSALFGALLFAELCVATLGSGLKLVDSPGAPVGASFGSPAEIGELLLTKFLLPFEVASFLLLIAAVGAVVLARRRGGLSATEEQARYSAMDILRPAGTGTMAEGVGGRHSLPAATSASAATVPTPEDMS
jgi:NADH-quinone oxidoreductase subunit J